MKQCVMCKSQFEEADLDFLGRCTPCFHKYMAMPEDERPKGLGIPFTPIYNGGTR